MACSGTPGVPRSRYPRFDRRLRSEAWLSVEKITYLKAFNYQVLQISIPHLGAGICCDSRYMQLGTATCRLAGHQRN